MDYCYTNPDSLISHEDALDKILSLKTKHLHSTQVSIHDCLNYILSDDVLSPIDVPSFNNSAMDGYALCVPNDKIKTPGVKKFNIISRVTAGEVSGELAPNEACRIFTGAPVPVGTNSVIRQEDCEVVEEEFVEVYSPIHIGSNIRPIGQDIQKDTVVITKGTKITPMHIGTLASMGICEVNVFSRLKVGLLCTGSELTPPHEKLSPGKIYNSNIYSIRGILQSLNCDVVSAITIKDSFDTTRSSLISLSKSCDVIITTGGVSVGEEDHVKSAVESLGSLEFWRVRTKPGKPLAFGYIDNTVFVGLPGNPVSSFVSLFIYGIPFIKKTQGRNLYHNSIVHLPINFERNNGEARREFIRVSTSLNNNGNLSLLKHPDQSSNVLTSILSSSGIAELHENRRYQVDDLVSYYDFIKVLHE